MAHRTKQRLLRKLGITEEELELLCRGYGGGRVVDKILQTHHLPVEALYYDPLPRLLVKAQILLPSEARWIQSGFS